MFVVFIVLKVLLLTCDIHGAEQNSVLQLHENIRRLDVLSDYHHGNDWNRSHRAPVRTYALAEVLRRTFLEFEQLYESIIQTVATNVPKISHDTEMLLNGLSNRTRDALDVFGNTALDVGDALLSEMFVIIERQLGEVIKEFQNLADSVDERFEWAVNQLNETLMNTTSEYDLWTTHVKQRLREVNDTELYKDGCRSLDEFMHRSTHELQKCCRITMKPMRTLCRDATSLLTEALNVVVDAMDRMQTCLEDKNSYLDYLMPCINLAYDNITSVVARAAQIKHLVNNMLPMKIIYTRSCFAIVMIDMKYRKNAIESNLF